MRIGRTDPPERGPVLARIPVPNGGRVGTVDRNCNLLAHAYTGNPLLPDGRTSE